MKDYLALQARQKEPEDEDSSSKSKSSGVSPPSSPKGASDTEYTPPLEGQPYLPTGESACQPSLLEITTYLRARNLPP